MEEWKMNEKFTVEGENKLKNEYNNRRIRERTEKKNNWRE